MDLTGPTPAGSGEISVGVGGLPSGSAAAITVISATGYRRDLAGPEMLADLPPGSYTVIADEVVIDRVRYTPVPTSQVIQVTAGSTPRLASITYSAMVDPNAGALTVTVSGLPDPMLAPLTLVSAGGATQPITATTVHSGLAPGSYTLLAGDFSSGGITYRAAPPSQPITISPNQTAGGSVTYSPIISSPATFGSLTLSIPGLPSGVNPNVTVTGPGGYSQLVTTAQTLGALDPGSYTIAAAPVASGGVTYAPDVPSQVVAIAAGQTMSVSVTYDDVTPSTQGTLILTMPGLPIGASANVTVSGPRGFGMVITGPQSVNGLVPGVYNVAAGNVSIGGFTYAPLSSSQARTVVGGASLAVTVPYAAIDGWLMVAVAGLPVGTTATAMVTGPSGFSQSFNAGLTRSGLEPGSYTISAGPMMVGGFLFAPVVSTVSATVVAGSQTVANVGYVAVDGALAVAISGLPAGGSGNVMVNGPGGYSSQLHAGQMLSGLAPGSYSLTASVVAVGGIDYAPNATVQTVTVAAGTTVPASVAYVVVVPPPPSLGALSLTVAGVANGEIVVTGPSGFSEQLGTSQTLNNLAPGLYTLAANAVAANGFHYAPSSATQLVTVAAGAIVPATVSYTATDGTLALTVLGLPEISAAAITVTGPGGFNRSITRSQPLTGLAPGAYTITSLDVTVATTIYAATPGAISRTVVVGSGVSATVTYAATAPPPAVGSLALTLSGLPNGASAIISVTGPDGTPQSITTSTTLNNLVPGSYSLTAAMVNAGGYSYAPAVASQVLTVVAGATTSVALSFAPVDGQLSVSLSGLPDAVPGSVTVSGPNGYAQQVTSSVLLGHLMPGSYSITAATIGNNGRTFGANVTTQQRVVTAGAIASTNVAYVELPPPPPTVGGLAVTIPGLPAGAGASVVVGGPNGFQRSLEGPQVLLGLAPGEYQIAAANVASNGYTYAPVMPSQSCTVVAGATAAASISYAATDGAIAVDVTGLPVGVNASVTLLGPNGYVHPMTGAGTVRGLAPGSYTVSAASVVTGNVTYEPSNAAIGQTVVVATTATVTVTYAALAPPPPTVGSLALTRSGVPSGALASVSVAGPNGYSRILTGSQTLNGLVPGAYTIVGADFVSGGFTYRASPSLQSLTVVAGATVTGNVVYAAIDADLALTISGLPAGSAASAVVIGPGGFNWSPVSTQTRSGLTPGSYTVTAAPIVVNGFSYAPVPLSQTVTVDAGVHAAASLGYSAGTGTLNLTISGLPAGTSGNVTLSGPGATAQRVDLSQTVTGLMPGGYQVTALNINSGVSSYTPAVSVQSVTITAGAATAITVSYAVTQETVAYRPIAAGYNVRSMVANGVTLHYQLFIPQGYDPSRAYPVILFAHGSGEAGTNNVQQLSVGLGPYVTANASTFPAVVIFPQTPPTGVFPSGEAGVTAANTMYLTALDSTLRQVHADRTRLYMTGVSNGAFRTWGITYNNSMLFAAIAPVSGGLRPQEAGASTVAEAAANGASRLQNLPIWQWHGDQDGTVSITTWGYPLRDAFAAYGPPSTYHFVVGVGLGHALEVNYYDPAFWAWLFAQHQ